MRIHILPFSLWLLVAAKIEARESQILPTAIKKMSPDQGEKFYSHYYAFPAANTFALPVSPLSARRISEDQDDARQLFANASAEIPYRQPFAPHLAFPEEEDYQQRIAERDGRGIFRRAADALAWLERRDWACPTGTSSCTAIGYPNSCCQNSETCVEITDTGLGNVGCCPQGATCGGPVSSCSNGNTPCASDIGGGCCIPGYVCEGVGCVRSSTVTPSPTGVITITSTSTSTGAGSGSQPTTVVVTVIVTITPSQSPPQTTTRTTTQNTTAASLPPTNTNSNTNSNETPIPPIRPTSSLPASNANGNEGNGAGGTNTFCPTGFYACLASAGGGCCQTGRDCQTTSCPPVQMTTLVNSNGVTVVVPATGVPAASTGTCAGGWFMCGKEAGPVAGCCPSGYSCGTASCTVGKAGATGTIAKELPGSGNGGGRVSGDGAVVLGVVLGVWGWMI